MCGPDDYRVVLVEVRLGRFGASPPAFPLQFLSSTQRQIGLSELLRTFLDHSGKQLNSMNSKIFVA